MTYVAKVSLPGYDVNTATPEQCAIHSSYPPLHAKLGQSPVHSATVVVNFSSGISLGSYHTLYSIAHGYGRVPLNISMIKISGLDGFPPYDFTLYGIGYTGVGATLAIEAYCTTTNYIIRIFDYNGWVSSNTELIVSYDIFAEDGV